MGCFITKKKVSDAAVLSQKNEVGEETKNIDFKHIEIPSSPKSEGSSLLCEFKMDESIYRIKIHSESPE